MILKLLPGRCVKLHIFCRYKSSTIDYNYLEKSFLPTHTFVKSLPSLPIPNLKDTCERYLESLRPFLENNQYENTVKLVKKFEYSDGKKYHELLVQNSKIKRHTSYINEPWFDMYLSSRAPLPINFNPFMSWKDQNVKEFNDPIIRASNFVISLLRFRRSFNESVLSPEIFFLKSKTNDGNLYKNVINFVPSMFKWHVSVLFKAFPLDMDQFKNLFNSTRIPKEDKDILQTFPHAKHILVMKHGKFYTFDALESNGDIKSPKSIYSALKRIAQFPESNEESISVFTTLNRQEWARLRNKLLEKSVNAQSLEAIDSAIAVICLDSKIETHNHNERIAHCHNFLHGCSNKPLNRWFDKSISLVFPENGYAAINFEHSWGDGVAVLRFFNEIYKDSLKNHFVNSSTKFEDQGLVKELKFDLDPSIKESIKIAKKNYKEITSNLKLCYLLYDKMSRDYFKMKKLSPDSMFQLAFQMAYYKVYNGKMPVTYESCSTAAFKHGRTETVRPVTSITKKTCKLIHSKDHSLLEIRSLLNECSKKHFELTKNASMGKGFDRHLFALKYLASKLDGKVPELYNDTSYLYSNHFVLSTSTLYGECFSGGGFGPVVEDGFGLGYGYIDQLLGVFCSSYKTKCDGDALLDALKTSFDEINTVLEAS